MLFPPDLTKNGVTQTEVHSEFNYKKLVLSIIIPEQIHILIYSSQPSSNSNVLKNRPLMHVL